MARKRKGRVQNFPLKCLNKKKKIVSNLSFLKQILANHTHFAKQKQQRRRSHTAGKLLKDLVHLLNMPSDASKIGGSPRKYLQTYLALLQSAA